MYVALFLSIKIMVIDYSYDSSRISGTWRFDIRPKDSYGQWKYYYYNKLSPRMTVKYLNMEWHDVYQRERFISHIKGNDLISQEILLMVKLDA